MTNKIAGYGMISPELAYELSYGRDPEHFFSKTGKIYGVTVVQRKRGGNRFKPSPFSSGGFHSAQQARSYVRELRKIERLNRRGVRIPKTFGVI